jgi:ABC-type sugar transport system ATPase subunit
MAILELKQLAKRYGQTTILNDVTLTVEPSDFAVIYGTPSSGKSVLVRLLTGLERPDGGQILLRGQDVTNASAGARNIGYVPQSFALYPHLSVYKNIAYPLTLSRTPKAQVEPAVQRVATLLGIAELLQRKPDQLSGGQKQRVAIARGLVKNTEVFILDDPLVGLDFKLRERLIDDLKQTQQTLGVTFIYTTSDAVETLMLARSIAVLHGGAHC